MADPRLAFIVARWAAVPAEMQAGIEAMVRAATAGKEATEGEQDGS